MAVHDHPGTRRRAGRGGAVPALLPALAAALAGGLAAAAGGGALPVLLASVAGAAAGTLLRQAAPPGAPTGGQVPAPASVDLAAGIGAASRGAASGGAGAAGAARRDRSLFEALPLGLVVIAADGTIRFANRAAAATFGLPAVAGLPAAALRTPRLLDLIDQARRDGASGTVGFSVSRAGEAHLVAHVRPLEGGEGEVLVAIEDRTGAIRAGELHRDFVANASHELKTPLAAVSGIIDTLLGHAREDPAATERFLGILRVQADRMTRLVEDLLSLNRIELNERVAPREPQDLGALVAEVVDALRPQAAEAAVRLAGEPLRTGAVRGDRNELAQVFRNLIENAIRYGGAGAEVTVAPAGTQPPAPGMVGVAVRDTGPGIPREHIPRLTERFYRVSVSRSRERGGTGLGLAIVKHVLNRHRGRLEIESRVGEGSCFTVWLPLADAAAAAAAESPPETARPDPRDAAGRTLTRG